MVSMAHPMSLALLPTLRFKEKSISIQQRPSSLHKLVLSNMLKQVGKPLERCTVRGVRRLQQTRRYGENGDVPEAPVMMSTSSLVIAACRPRLYFIRNELIISDAFFEALSIALRLLMVRVQLGYGLKKPI